MFDLDKFSEVIQTITKNKTRSFLTAFGVFWGIFMLVILIGGGEGLQFILRKQVGDIAQNSAFVFTNRTGEAYKGFKKGRDWDMEITDVNILQNNVPHLGFLAPMIFGYGKVVNGERGNDYSIKGITPDMQIITKQAILLQGRFINEMDIQQERKVCVIGQRVFQTLFLNGENPIGTYIRIRGVYYQIIGVTKAYSENINIGASENESVSIPLTTAQKTFRMGNVIHGMMFTSAQGYKVADIQNDFEQVLKRVHNISPTDKKAVGIENLEQLFNMFNGLFLGVNILIWLVGIGTLLAGVIGVSNIMMVTVKERTQEIGIRRALGARPRQIVSQILSETALLTSIAGMLGIVFGVIILQVVDVMLRNGEETSGFMMNFWTAISAAIVLLSLSILTGLAPAWHAMKIKAIEALREE
jgi:putative ABC transport system permease protein